MGRYGWGPSKLHEHEQEHEDPEEGIREKRTSWPGKIPHTRHPSTQEIGVNQSYIY